MHIGKNIGTGMVVLLPSVNTCASKAEKFLLSVSTLTGSQDITRTILIANSQSGENMCIVRGRNCWGICMNVKNIDNQPNIG